MVPVIGKIFLQASVTHSALQKICIGNVHDQRQGSHLKFSFCETHWFLQAAPRIASSTRDSSWFSTCLSSWTSTAVCMPHVHRIKHTGPNLAGLAANQSKSRRYILYLTAWLSYVGERTGASRQNHFPSCVSHKWVLIHKRLVSLHPFLSLVNPAWYWLTLFKWFNAMRTSRFL